MGKTIIKSVSKAFRILEILLSNPNGLALTEMSNEISIKTSDLHHLMSTFTQNQYAVKDTTTNRYKISDKLVKRVIDYLNHISLYSVGKPYLSELNNHCRDKCYLCVFQDNTIRYIYSINEDNNVEHYNHNMEYLDKLHCTAIGKIFLANLGENDLEKYIRKTGLKGYTDNTICTKEKLDQEINKIRLHNYATNSEESSYGDCGIAVPIKNYSKRTIGAMGLSFRKDSNDSNNIEELIEILSKIGLDLSSQIGFIKDS